MTSERLNLRTAAQKRLIALTAENYELYDHPKSCINSRQLTIRDVSKIGTDSTASAKFLATALLSAFTKPGTLDDEKRQPNGNQNPQNKKATPKNGLSV